MPNTHTSLQHQLSQVVILRSHHNTERMKKQKLRSQNKPQTYRKPVVMLPEINSGGLFESASACQINDFNVNLKIAFMIQKV